MSKEINPLIQAYVGPELPREYIFINPSQRPEKLDDLLKLYYRKWLVHPLKRHTAHLYSEYLKSRDCEFIGITGSAGKTTVKEMIASVLSRQYNTRWTYANIDPVYNIPQTILRSPIATQKMILEMGIEFPGEMDFYLWLAQPSVGVLTNIYWTHTQFLGDLNGVLKEKSRLIKSLPEYGYAILNYDDANIRKILNDTRAKIIWCSSKKKTNVFAEDVQITDDYKTRFVLNLQGDSVEVELPLLGKHFVPLALAASAVGQISDMSTKDIKKGLESVEPQPHRMIPIHLANGATLIDDAYNANPLATIEAINVLREISKNRRSILVLGEMKELGVYEERGHREVGRFANKVGVDKLFTLGDLTTFTIDEAVAHGTPRKNTFCAANKQELTDKLIETIREDDIILIKGSRSMKMEDVVDNICKAIN